MGLQEQVHRLRRQADQRCAGRRPRAEGRAASRPTATSCTPPTRTPRPTSSAAGASSPTGTWRRSPTRSRRRSSRPCSPLQPARLTAGEVEAREQNSERRDTYRSAEEQQLGWLRAVDRKGGKTHRHDRRLRRAPDDQGHQRRGGQRRLAGPVRQAARGALRRRRDARDDRPREHLRLRRHGHRPPARRPGADVRRASDRRHAEARRVRPSAARSPTSRSTPSAPPASSTASSTCSPSPSASARTRTPRAPRRRRSRSSCR